MSASEQYFSIASFNLPQFRCHRSLPILFPMVGKGIWVIKLRETMMILDLHRQGLSVSAITKQTSIDRKTVRKYIKHGLEAPAYGPRKPRATMIDPVHHLSPRASKDLSWSREAAWLHRRLYSHDGFSVGHQTHNHARIRGPLRDAVWQAGTGRLRPVPCRLH